MGSLRLPRLLTVAALLYAVIQLLSRTGVLNGYFMIIINRSLVFVILAVSLNLINGITGQFSLGHMGFAAVGAYVSGSITTLIFKYTPEQVASFGGNVVFVIAIVAGGLAAAVVGFLIGFPSLRLKGDYLAIVTLGFGEIIRTILNNIDAVGGPRGLLGIPKFSELHQHLRLRVPDHRGAPQSRAILPRAGPCSRSGRTSWPPSSRA